MKFYIILFIIIGITFIIYDVYKTISHMPNSKISSEQFEQIKQNGLIHFTHPNNVESIIKNGLYGKESNMSYPERKLGKLCWTYIYSDFEDIDKKHKILIKKKKGRNNPEEYGVCVRLTGFDDATLNKFFTRNKMCIINDNAIVFRGDILKAQNIKIIKIW